MHSSTADATAAAAAAAAAAVVVDTVDGRSFTHHRCSWSSQVGTNTHTSRSTYGSGVSSAAALRPPLCSFLLVAVLDAAADAVEGQEKRARKAVEAAQGEKENWKLKSAGQSWQREEKERERDSDGDG